VKLRIRRHDPTIEFAAVRVARLENLHGCSAIVQTQVSLSLSGIRAVAVETVIAQNRADIAVEVHGRFIGRDACGDCEETADGQSRE
jgi:hypothetical protein